jgi:hypothetical protein
VITIPNNLGKDVKIEEENDNIQSKYETPIKEKANNPK